MGCDYSKKAKAQFNNTLSQLDSNLRLLQQRKSALQQLIQDIKQPSSGKQGYEKIESQITSRLDRLQSMICNFQSLHMTATLRKGTSIEQSSSESSSRIFEREEIPNHQVQQSPLSTPRAPEKNSILQDPAIKAIIQKKRKALEKQNIHKKAPVKSPQTPSGRAILDDPAIKALIDKKKKALDSKSGKVKVFKKEPQVPSGKAILEDPEIKAIIDQKRRALEHKGRKKKRDVNNEEDRV